MRCATPACTTRRRCAWARSAATYLPSEPGQYRRGLDGRVLRCPWHGWEYDITTGHNLIDPGRKLTTYPVTVEDGDLVVHIGGPTPDARPTATPER